MKIICLCATYGRPDYILNTSVECFLRQKHEDKHLLIWDDTGRDIKLSGYDNITVIDNKRRIHLSDKYVDMCNYSLDHLNPDGFAVWDDDDLYLPNHLTNMANCFEHRKWCKPSKAYIYYNKLSLEGTGKAWHATIGVRKDGYLKSPRKSDLVAAFDLQYLKQLYKDLGHPCDSFKETADFVYRWSNTKTNHSSGRLSRQGHLAYSPQNKKDIEIVPSLDKYARELEYLFDV